MFFCNSTLAAWLISERSFLNIWINDLRRMSGNESSLWAATHKCICSHIAEVPIWGIPQKSCRKIRFFMKQKVKSELKDSSYDKENRQIQGKKNRPQRKKNTQKINSNANDVEISEFFPSCSYCVSVSYCLLSHSPLSTLSVEQRRV